MGAKKALETTATQEWVRKHNKRLSVAFHIVHKNTQKTAAQVKERYDASAKAERGCWYTLPDGKGMVNWQSSGRRKSRS